MSIYIATITDDSSRAKATYYFSEPPSSEDIKEVLNKDADTYTRQTDETPTLLRKYVGLVTNFFYYPEDLKYGAMSRNMVPIKKGAERADIRLSIVMVPCHKGTYENKPDVIVASVSNVKAKEAKTI